MKNFKKIVIGLFICGLFIVPCFSSNEIYQACSSLFIEQLSDGVNYTEILFSGGSNKNIYNLTSGFCANIANLKCISTGDGAAVDYFDASQSLFLTVLCNSVKQGSFYHIGNEVLKKKSFIDFGIVSSETGFTESCHRYRGMNSCNYAYYLPWIFNKIENDMFNVRQARFLGVDELSESFNPEDAANKLSISMMPGLSIQKGLNAGICDSNSDYYKSTCKTLKNYVKDAENLLRNTSVIDIEILQELKDSADCENNPDYSILYCGLLGTNSEYRFLNAVYNEYFWYRVFLSYYTSYINSSDFVDGDQDEQDKYEENQERISLVQNQIIKSKSAITLSLRSLTEMTYSFPVHVGFLMYHEDAKLFMENSSKLYAPIRTLYDKLRNVQIKES